MERFCAQTLNRIYLNDFNINLYQRDNILKLQLLVYNQFSVFCFCNFIQDLWHKCGYNNDKTSNFFASSLILFFTRNAFLLYLKKR